MAIKWNKGENNETVISGHFFGNINFPRSFIIAFCDQDDVVSPEYDGNDDGKARDASSYDILVYPNVLDFYHACRDYFVNLGHS